MGADMNIGNIGDDDIQEQKRTQPTETNLHERTTWDSRNNRLKILCLQLLLDDFCQMLCTRQHSTGL